MPSIRIRQMRSCDLPFGLYLNKQAGWNQSSEDWGRILDLEPNGSLVAERNGRAVGTLSTCVFKKEVAWIAMVLVDREARGQGIGTTLVSHALEMLDKQGILSVWLDASTLGQTIYEKLGFQSRFELLRYQGVLPTTSAVDQVRPFEGDDLDAVVRLDQSCSGADRRKLLGQLLCQQPCEMRVVKESDRVFGYLATRPGSDARQIGPCIAMTIEAGKLLLQDICHRHAGTRVFVDIPDYHREAKAWARACGLNVCRSFLRMVRGAVPERREEYLWASFGPEKG